jgi:toxin YoeB
MEHLSATELRNHLKAVLDRVNTHHVPISIGRAGGREVVLLDGEDYRSIIEICLAACRTPTTGIGKPEPLRFYFQGYWSRRIDQEHRLVCAFDETDLTVIQCRFRYQQD